MSNQIEIKKANPIRNELKEIRKSIDELTNVVTYILDIWAHTQQTNKHEKFINNLPDDRHDDSRIRKSYHD